MGSTTKSTESEFKGGWMYRTEDDLCMEVLRYLASRPKNSGATEGQIVSVIKTTPFCRVKKEADSDPERTKGDKAFFADLRREAMIPTIKKLHNMGYSPMEVAGALDIPYSTAYYYCRKIKNHIRIKRSNACWERDPTVPGDHFRRVRLSRSKAAIAAEREIIAKAKEKRERRIARRRVQAA